MGDLVANHWVDADHKRGLWRVSPLAAYLAGKPQWRTLIDVDALGKAEGKSWVWHGADCLPPDYQRCLVSLSPGGSDADVVREFDLATGKFVAGGFTIPEGKNSADLDRPGHICWWRASKARGRRPSSGYPRIVKEWKRGTPLERRDQGRRSAETDIGISPFAVMDGDIRRVAISRNVGLLRIARVDARARRPLGRSAGAARRRTSMPSSPARRSSLWSRRSARCSRARWSLTTLRDMLAGQKPRTGCWSWRRRKTQAIEEVSATDNVLWIKALDDVSGKLFAL